MKPLILFGLCLLLATRGVGAGPFEDGVAAYGQHDYAAALKLWLPLAEQGHREAQFNIAVLYEQGLGVPEDALEAIKWYLMAAQQGDVQAQYNVGELYETGRGSAKDLEQARKWYRVAMDNPSTDVETLKIKQRARARLDGLTSVREDVIAYKGGRFVIARSSDGTCVVALQGGISKEGVKSFDDVIQRAADLGCSNPMLLLESPGGLLFDALDLGIKIRHAGFRTIARSGCASACAFIFLGGTERMLVGSKAKIGLHQVSQRGVCSPFTYTDAARDMSAYLKQVVPAGADEIMDLIMQTSCTDITWISGQRALSLGIATKLEWEGIAVGPMRRGSVQQGSVAAAETRSGGPNSSAAPADLFPPTYFEFLLRQRIGEGQVDTPELRGALRNELNTRELLVREAKKNGIDTAAAEAAAANAATLSGAEVALTAQTAVVRAYMADYIKAHPISNQALRAEYESTKAKMGDKEYKVRHILVGTEEDAKDIIAKLQRGESFEALVSEYSKDSGSKTRGGDLGWNSPPNFVKPFSDAMVATPKGTFTTTPVQTQYGWHVIEVDDIRDSRVPSFDAVKTELAKRMQSEMVAAYLRELRAANGF